MTPADVQASSTAAAHSLDRSAPTRRRRRRRRAHRRGRARGGRRRRRTRPSPPPPWRSSRRRTRSSRCGSGSRRGSPTATAAARWAARSASPLARLKPNLESFCPVAMYVCVWAWTPGVTRSRTSGDRQACAVQRVEAIELVEAVDDDAPHAGSRSPARNSSMLLLLPCMTHAAAGTPAASTTCSSPPLATSNSRPFLVHEAGDGPTEERLGGVDHPAVAEGGDRLAAAGADVVDVVHEQRRAELAGQVEQRAAADAQRRRRVRPSPSRAATGTRSAP